MGSVRREPEGATAPCDPYAGPAEACGAEGAWTAVEVRPGATRVQVAATAQGRPVVAYDVPVQGRGRHHEDGTPEADVTS